MCKKLLTLLCLIFIYNVAVSQDYVSLYDQCNYAGKRFTLEAGTYRLYQMKIDNDRLSSIVIPSGLKITIYENDGFAVKSKTYFTNISCLENEWRNMASSVVVERDFQTPGYGKNDFVTFFTDCYSKGNSQSFYPGIYTGNQLNLLKYNISSFTINGNLRVKLYLNNDNNTRNYTTYNESQSCLPAIHNDKTGSLVIEYKSASLPNTGIGGTGNFVTLFSDCNFEGNALRLKPGYYQGDKLGIMKYDISSIQVSSNLKVKAFIDNEFLSGQSINITESNTCLNNEMKNRIGSLVIEEKSNQGNYPPQNAEKVILYADILYKGQSTEILPGTYKTMAEAGFIDNALSSLIVPPDYRVVLYEFENFGGRSYTITASKSMFTLSGWNDKASSIAVYRDR
jgi:hypothetical protein